MLGAVSAPQPVLKSWVSYWTQGKQTVVSYLGSQSLSEDWDLILGMLSLKALFYAKQYGMNYSIPQPQGAVGFVCPLNFCDMLVLCEPGWGLIAATGSWVDLSRYSVHHKRVLRLVCAYQLLTERDMSETKSWVQGQVLKGREMSMNLCRKVSRE